MDREFQANVGGSPPSRPSSPVVGYPRSGNPPSTPATVEGAWWAYMMTEELRNAIVALGGTPDPALVNQLATAMVARLAQLSAANTFTAVQNITLIGNNLPEFVFYRNDSTPAASDFVTRLSGYGNNLSLGQVLYGDVLVRIVDPTAGSEDGEIVFRRVLAGGLSEAFCIRAGLYANGLADMGVGTGNFTEVYKNGVAIGSGFGVGQTWASQAKSIATLYTNSTGKPIAVALTYTGSLTTITVAGTIIYSDQSAVSGATTTGTMFVVPDGATYQVDGGTVSSWFELR